jgi:predicted membrane protein
MSNHNRKSILGNVIINFFLAAMALMLAVPYYYIFDLVFRLIFPLSLKGTFIQIIAILFFLIGITIYIISIIYAWKWLKKNNMDKIMSEWGKKDKAQ